MSVAVWARFRHCFFVALPLLDGQELEELPPDVSEGSSGAGLETPKENLDEEVL